MKLVAMVVFTAVLAGATTSAGATIALVVHSPADTPADATLYVAGNHPSLGPWAPSAHALSRADDDTWRTGLMLPDGFDLQFKVTLGSWSTVEWALDGSDIANHAVRVADGREVAIHVAAWGDSHDAAAHGHLQHTLTGNVQRVQGFHSKVLGNQRTIIVYLPPTYDNEPARRYPVLAAQ